MSACKPELLRTISEATTSSSSSSGASGGGGAALSTPTVASVTSSTANGTYNLGGAIAIQVTFSEAVTVNTTAGTPTLTLETGTVDRSVRYTSGSGTAILTFQYYVRVNDFSLDLDYVNTTSLALHGGTIVSSSTGVAADLTLPVPGAAGSLGFSKALVVFGNLFNTSLAGYGTAVSKDGNIIVGTRPNVVGGIGYLYRWDPSSYSYTETVVAPADLVGGDHFGFSVAVDGNSILFGAPNKNASQGKAYLLQYDPSSDSWLESSFTAFDGAAADRYGTSVAISGDMLAIGSPAATIGGNVSQGAIYLYRFDPSGHVWVAQKITAFDGVAFINFGTSLAMDGTTMVVGAPLSSGFRGSAYVYRYDPSSNDWLTVNKLLASDGVGTTDRFGMSVDVDGTTVVVGAPYDDIGAQAAQGSAYIFRYDPNLNSWDETKVTASDGLANDNFGYASVSVSGNTVAVGAPYADIGGNLDRGAVYTYTFEPSADAWDENKITVAMGGAANDAFGYSVHMDGKWLTVGAPNGSKMFVYDLSYVIEQQSSISAFDGAAGDHFGQSVAVDSETIVAGSPDDNASQGAVYLYQYDPALATWNESKITASDGAAGDQFGYSVSVSGDTIAVGAYLDDVLASVNQGSVYVYRHDPATNTWYEDHLFASDGGIGYNVGFSVSVNGNSVVAGAPLGRVGGIQTGAAYLFRFDPSDNSWKEYKLTASDGVVGDFFGGAVSVYGMTVVVGAYQAMIGANAAQGAAYIYRLDVSDNSWNEYKLSASDGAVSDGFGYSVAVHGTAVLVGARYADVGANSDQGAAYLYRYDPNGFTWEEKKIVASDGAASDDFGVSVSLDGDSAFIGADNARVLGNNGQGASYLFQFDPSLLDWREDKITASNGSSGDTFGVAVGIQGDTLVSGASLRSAGQGAVYAIPKP